MYYAYLSLHTIIFAPPVSNHFGLYIHGIALLTHSTLTVCYISYTQLLVPYSFTEPWFIEMTRVFAIALSS